MKFQLNVLSDLSERIPYSVPTIPIYVGGGELKHFHKYSTACHWHPDLEFAWPIKGDMDFFVNGKVFHVPEKQGIFINSKRLHYNFSSTQSNCVYLVATVNPFVFNDGLSSLRMYMEEKFGSSNEDVILMTNQELWHNELFNKIQQVYKEVYEGKCDTLQILSLIFDACSTIHAKIKYIEQEEMNEEYWMTIWKMMGFIHKHFSDKILLDDIAAAGSVCRTKCCELFNKYLNRTPNIYLNDYRIQKSCEMLRNTSCSIIEIALSCGFQSASYYTFNFRKETGYTPREYRNRFEKSEKSKIIY